MEELKEKLKECQKRLALIIQKLGLEEKKKRISELEKESEKSDFWQDIQRSQKLMAELSSLKEEVEMVEKLEKKTVDAQTMIDLGMEAELKQGASEIEKDLEKLELQTFLAGPYDKNEAILAIHAGQGGTEAMDWAQMLERMYLRYAENKGWQTDIVDQTPGEEAGVKSATMTISGPYAYGYLKGEAGVHRLVRQSPFNADRLRQTSFALVEVLPKIDQTPEVKIKDEELEWQFFRASTQGGQNVQKVSTAVRLRHKPTGIVVTSQSQRYQQQNRKIALSLLLAKLWVLAKARAKEEKQKIKGEYKIAGWGNQIRSYVLHPYKMVKDLRTEVESSQPEKVLNGELEQFIEAELKSMV